MLKKLPKQLRAHKIWINALVEDHIAADGRKLAAKTPVNEKLLPVDVTNAANLLSFAEAVDRHIADPRLGVGVVFGHSKELPLVGIDLDVDPEKTDLLNFALKLCQESGSYYEKSRNSGYHILGLYPPDLKLGKKGVLKTPYGPLKCEIYNHSRYFLCTGKRGKASPETVSSVQGLIDSLLAKLDRSTSSKADGVSERPLPGTPLPLSPPLKDSQILKKLESGKQSLAWITLHKEGSLAEHDDNHSNAVMAWHNMVAFYTQDYEQVTRLFKKSALNRGKWKTENNAFGSKWARVNGAHPFQHAKILAGQTCRYSGKAPAASGPIEDNKYVLLLKELGEVRRDLFTGEIHVFHEGVWKNAFDEHIENQLKSMCHDKGKEYPITQIRPKLTAFMHSLKPQLLIDIPVWDGVDRLHTMANCCSFVEECLNPAIFEDFLKDWGARLWDRIYDTTVNNRMILFQGKQNIGKDVFFRTLVQGFGPYQALLTITSRGNERDYMEQIAQAVVVTVSEFEKTRQMGGGILKELINKPFSTYRSPYARKAKEHKNRASWLGASNPEQVLNEEGANRRYLLFKLKGPRYEAIKHEYDRSMDASMQLIAQYKYLSEHKYQASAENEALMVKLMESYAPDNKEDCLVKDFDMYIQERLRSERKEDEFWLYAHNEISSEIKRMANYYDLTAPDILSTLRQHGRTWRHKLGNFYGPENYVSDNSDKMKDKRAAFIKEFKQRNKSLQSSLQKKYQGR